MYTYKGTFLVLQESIPLILGMNFFAKVEPRVDWKAGRVFVKSMELPVCSFGTKDCKSIADVVVKTRPSATSRANTFAELSVEEAVDVDDVEEADVVEQLYEGVPVVTQDKNKESKVTSVTSRVEKCVCVGCGKHLGNAVSEHCARCANKSFCHLPDQLRDEDGSVVDVSNVSDSQGSESALQKSCEIVPLKQFVRGGKHGQYEAYGVCMFEDELCDDNSC